MDREKTASMTDDVIKSLGATIPAQLEYETAEAYRKIRDVLDGKVVEFVANRLQLSPEELPIALAAEQVDGVALAIYNIEARGQSVIIGDQTGIGKGRQAAAMIRYGMLAGYLPIFLTDRYTLFSDMYRDCKALGIQNARPLILNQKVSIVDFDKPVADERIPAEDEIWSPDSEADEDEEEAAGIYARQYEEVYKSPKKAELELMYREGDIPAGRFEYVMLTYSQLKDARKDRTRLEFLTSLCEKHRVLFVFDEAHKSSSVTAGKISVITQSINSILEKSTQTQCVFLSATFAKRPECLITFMRQTLLSSLATNETLQTAFANGGVPMQEYVASKLAREGQMVRREHSGEGIPEPVYTYLEEELGMHSELFDKVMYWFREMIVLSEMIKGYMKKASLLGADTFRPYPTRAQLFYVNKILLLSLKARDVAEAAVRDVRAGKSVVIGMSDTLECVVRDTLDPSSRECPRADFSTILLRLLEKTMGNPRRPDMTVFDIDLANVADPVEIIAMQEEIRALHDQIRAGISEEVFHLPMSPIDVIRQLITQERFTDRRGVERNIRFEECTGRARQLEYLSPEGEDEYVNATVMSRKKRHSNHIYNDFQNNKLDVILINACGAIGASAHAVATAEVPESEVRQRKMLIVQNDLDVNIDLQKRGRINRTGQVESLPPLYEYVITAIPSEKRLNMMLRAKLRSLSANTTANQDQDRKQADFLDITNKYGNLVAQEFIAANQELDTLLGLGKTATASQLLARIAMLGVAAQQDIIDEVFGAYQNLEQELRRINQWDLEREYRDFEAEFVGEELFSAPIDKTALGGASMLTTFRCRHRTFPYDSQTLRQQVGPEMMEYGENLYESRELKQEIDKYYRAEKKKIRTHIQGRKEKLITATTVALTKYGLSPQEIVRLLQLMEYAALISAQNEIQQIIDGKPKAERIMRKLDSYQAEMQELEGREGRDLNAKDRQRQRLMKAISKTRIGQGYVNILPWMPVEENVERVMAVLKEVRFGKDPDKRFLPGKVQYVFALSAVHKELVLNLVEKGSQNNYDRLMGILGSYKWHFNSAVWDREIGKYNNRILERKIITGNILGAFANPVIQKMKPRFVTFSLAADADGNSNIERGLLLPMTGENIDKLLADVSLPLDEGVMYATATNHVYPISGIGVDFALIPSNAAGELRFHTSVHEKDSKKFEADERFDSIRKHFKATRVTSIYNTRYNISARRQLKRYDTKELAASSEEFIETVSLLASLRATILIPRQYMSVGQLRGYARGRQIDEGSNWPALDWKATSSLPPERREVSLRITAPSAPGEGAVTYVEEFSPLTVLCRRTLALQGRSFNEPTILEQARTLYFEWMDLAEKPQEEIDNHWLAIAAGITDELYRILVNSPGIPVIKFKDILLKTLEEEANKYAISAVGQIIARFREEMAFLAPAKEEAVRFLDGCLYDARLAKIRKSLEDYIEGKTKIIMDV